MKEIICTILAFAVLSLARGQQLPEYFVYLTHGNILIQHTIEKNQIKPKQFIYLSDIIEIKDTHSEVELVNRQGDFLVLNIKGSYKVSDLDQKMRKPTAGLTKKYLLLVWEAFSHTYSDFEIYKKETIAASWGGAARGVDCSIEKFPLRNILFSSDSLIFRWENEDSTKIYSFTLNDSDQKPIIEMLIRDTQLVLLTSSLPLGDYYWSAKSAASKCKIVNDNKVTLISKTQERLQTDSIIKTVPFEKDTILYNLRVSDALGKSGYIEKAFKYFNNSWEFFIQSK